MSRTQTGQVWLNVHKESHHFSCAHFTIFSASERENLHGHNYTVRARAQCSIGDSGLCFDYNKLKTMIEKVCGVLDETTVLPKHSPFLRFRDEEPYVCVEFASECLKFLPRDVTLLDIRNVTVEELATWVLSQLTSKEKFLSMSISRFELTIASGPSESATVSWTPE